MLWTHKEMHDQKRTKITLLEERFHDIRRNWKYYSYLLSDVPSFEDETFSKEGRAITPGLVNSELIIFIVNFYDF